MHAGSPLTVACQPGREEGGGGMCDRGRGGVGPEEGGRKYIAGEGGSTSIQK